MQVITINLKELQDDYHHFYKENNLYLIDKKYKDLKNKQLTSLHKKKKVINTDIQCILQSKKNKILTFFRSNKNQGTYRKVSQATSFLKKYNLLAAPTDTLYGMLGAYNTVMAKKMHLLRERPMHQPFILLINQIEMFHPYVELEYYQHDEHNHILKLLYEKWPGKNSFIFKKTSSLDYPVTSKIAFRCVSDLDNIFLYMLLSLLKKPLLAPSLNKTNQPALFQLKDIKKTFKNIINVCVEDTSEYCKNHKSSNLFDTTGVSTHKVR